MILPSITTTNGSPKVTSWQEKVAEIDKLGLKRIALFPTCLEEPERQKLYKTLEATNLRAIPFVHLRGDMPPQELDYLIKRWGTKVFNIHTQKRHSLFYDYSKYKDMIYIENGWPGVDEQEVHGFAGLCIDFSHLENDRLLNKQLYKDTIKAVQKYSIGCNHISSILKESFNDVMGYEVYAAHYSENLSEFDYLKKYPKKYFSKYIAIELENSLQDQLKIINYIEKELYKTAL